MTMKVIKSRLISKKNIAEVKENVINLLTLKLEGLSTVSIHQSIIHCQRTESTNQSQHTVSIHD